MRTAAALTALILLTACGGTRDTAKVSLSPAELDVAATAEATCSHGAMRDERSYIVCEKGVTKLPEFRAALRSPVNPSLNIKQVAKQFAVAPQVFTGIEAAIHSDLGSDNAQTGAKKTSSPYDNVTVDGKIFDVYRVGLGEKVGTVFIERKTKKQ